MNTPLQSTSLSGEELAPTEPIIDEHQEGHAEGEAGHIHLPNPSYWPLVVGAAILIIMIGLLISKSTLVLVIIGIPVLLFGIMGFALENPNASLEAEVKAGEYAMSYAEAATSGKPTVLGQIALRDAEDVLENTITISSTAWSAHPVKVFVEREGVVLSLYGKVELEAQKEEVEAALRKMPGVIDVMNFLVAEDELLNTVNRLIDDLKASGKLEGAKDLSVLVENYIVSLYGEVPTPEMKYMLEREITKLPGARVVINHIGLDKDIPGNLGRTSNRIARI
ncbi:MAG TPA: BON domain-containing protein [Ktedonobacteraceae bacterium]|nr:BON domain-containing protein [Ktedonobacteraceae bacterium]